MMMFTGSAVDTLPLAGRDQGWGMFDPDIGAKPHPLATSPVEGEVPRGRRGQPDARAEANL
jgi:hypothetical protein